MGKKADHYDEAEDLYVVEGFTLEAIAGKLPVSLTTLSRWKQEGEWEERRRELARALREIKRNTILLRQRLSLAALENLDPQKVYAFSRLEPRAAAASDRPEARREVEPDLPALFLKSLEFMAGVLKDEDPEGLKVLARNFDLIVNRFKALHAQTA
jgi:hypothetical protein